MNSDDDDVVVEPNSTLRSINASDRRTESVVTCPASTDNSFFYIGISSDQKGRGLFAAMDIPPLSVIHVAPCIVVPKEEYESHIKHTIFEHYVFNDTTSGNKLLALGYGSLFNHDSYHPNIIYHIYSKQQTIEYKSGAQIIPKDTELCISYGSNLWFDDDDGGGGVKPKSNDDSSDDDDDTTGEFLKRMEC
jgi:hypothetical protein